MKDGYFIKIFKRHTHRCKKEFLLLDTLARRDVAVPLPIALSWGNSQAVLITEFIDGTPLDQFLLNNWRFLDVKEKYNVTKKVSKLLCKIIKAGLYHKDLHPGNILIDCSGVLYITDLHRARIVRNLSFNKIKKMLIQMNMFSSLMIEDRYRLCVARRVLYNLNLKIKKREFLRRLERETLEECIRLWNRRKRKFEKRRKCGIRLKRNGQFIIVHPSYADEVDKFLIAVKSPIQVFKDSRSSLVGVIVHNGKRYVVKVYRQKNWLKKMKDIFRASRAVRAWYGAQDLIQRGIPTPQPILCMEEKKGICKKSLLITEYIEGDNLSVWLKLHKDKVKDRERLEEDLKNLISSMHKREITHRDLKGSNILVGENRFYIIDTHCVESGFWRWYFKRKNRLELNRIWSSVN